MRSPSMPATAPHAWTQEAGDHDRRRLRTILRDDLGGTLDLDLAQSGLDEVARACDALLESNLTCGTCVIRVWAGADIYRLRRDMSVPVCVHIARVSSPEREVALSEDALRRFVHLVDATERLRSQPDAPRSSLISYAL